MSDRVVVGHLPDCDLHTMIRKVPGIPARYDARVPGGTAWANLCEECFVRVGARLGTGFGQRLMLEGEKWSPSDIVSPEREEEP